MQGSLDTMGFNIRAWEAVRNSDIRIGHGKEKNHIVCKNIKNLFGRSVAL